MTPPRRKCRFPHRVRATHNLVMMDGEVIPEGSLGWLVSHSHLWNDPNVEFDDYGYREIVRGDFQTIREKGRLIRRVINKEQN